MTAEEVKKYINQVAFSSAEEFIQNTKANQINRLLAILASAPPPHSHGGAKIESIRFPIKKGRRLFIGLAMVPQSSVKTRRKERGTTVTLTLQEEEQNIWNRRASASW